MLLRSVEKSDLVNALAYLTIPALIGPVAGPPLGGFITTYFHWRWIFWINLPIGILGIALSLRFIANLREEAVGRFDFKGFFLSGLGLLGLISGVSVIGRGMAPWWVVVGMIVTSVALLAAYVRHAGENEDAILDLKLLRIPTFFAGVAGGFIFRTGIGALPFLVPLLLQLGFGLTPFQSGSLTFATAAGALLMKFTASTALRWLGFRNALVACGLISGAFMASYSLFTITTPHWMIFLALLAGGFFRSLEFTALNAISYADINPPRMSRATSFASVSQQMSGAVGVAIAAVCIQLIQVSLGDQTLVSRDLSLAFVLVAIISSSAVLVFARLAPDAGSAVSGKITPSEQEHAAAAAE